MTKKLTKEQLLESLKDPSLAKEAQAYLKESGDERLEKILKGISIGEDDDIDTISKKYQGQIAELVGYFNDQLEKNKKTAVAEAQAPEREKERRKVQEFQKANPGMDNQEVVDMMQPLYDKGKTLEECYSIACRGLGLDPKTGKEPEADAGKDKDKGKDAAKGKDMDDKDKKAGAKVSSLRSDIVDDEGGEPADKKKDDTPVSISDSLSANANTLLAKPEFENLFDE